MSTSAYLLRDLLKEVSRSFYLTLRVLPGPIRSQVGLAYLLARATDTVADTEVISVDERLAALRRLRDAILDNNTGSFGLDVSGTGPERILLERINDVLALLNTFDPADRQRIRDVLTIIVSGQELDLTRFGTASIKDIHALNTADELDDYTYRVAGCVGEFWTRMCLAHLLPQMPEARLLEDGVRFGKALQLVNVLRDLPRDLRNGRCYLPAAELTKAALKPSDLLDTTNEPRVRPIYNRWLDLAHSHLAAAWRYTNTLPRSQVRLRLACAWPILIGKQTLDGLAHGAILNPESRIKISRSAVRGVIARSVLLYPFRSAWQAQFGDHQRSLSGKNS
jgi:farnesyl-diphosphate farnesyltransferase